MGEFNGVRGYLNFKWYVKCELSVFVLKFYLFLWLIIWFVVILVKSVKRMKWVIYLVFLIVSYSV